MDAPPPSDLDPYLAYDTQPIQAPRNRGNERDEGDNSSDDDKAQEPEMLPLHSWFTEKLRKVAFAGSCCGSVAFLLLVSGWDHGWIPGIKSQFAMADEVHELKNQSVAAKSDLSRLVILQLAQAIRDIEHEICLADTNFKQQQLDGLQYEYIARTGGRYPHTECKKA